MIHWYHQRNREDERKRRKSSRHQTRQYNPRNHDTNYGVVQQEEANLFKQNKNGQIHREEDLIDQET